MNIIKASAQPSKATLPATRSHVDLPRRFVSGVLAGIISVTPLPSLAAVDTSQLTPYQRGKNLEYGLLNNRIRSCETVAQPSCVSTSSLSDVYSPPWTVTSTITPEEAMNELEIALKSLSPEGVEILEESRPTDSRSVYKRFKVPSAFDYDVFEVLIAKQPPPYDDELLVSYRSQASSVKYLWPITQPISDMGAQRKRVVGLRKKLGWRIQGCDLTECYQEVF